MIVTVFIEYQTYCFFITEGRSALQTLETSGLWWVSWSTACKSLSEVRPLMQSALQYIALLFSINFTEPAVVDIAPFSSGFDTSCANGISIEAIYPLPSLFDFSLVLPPVGL
jgi:hypothetical protein